MRRSCFAGLALLVLLGGCGSGTRQAAAPERTSTLPGAGKPPIRLATKNFTEAFIVGELYAQALRAVLTDPQGIFGFQNLVPVVRSATLRRQGPAFARTLDAVTARLTNQALQQMNAAVDLHKEPPADVARRFLEEGGQR